MGIASASCRKVRLVLRLLERGEKVRILTQGVFIFAVGLKESTFKVHI
jgi:hypothetical protein